MFPAPGEPMIQKVNEEVQEISVRGGGKQLHLQDQNVKFSVNVATRKKIEKKEKNRRTVTRAKPKLSL